MTHFHDYKNYEHNTTSFCLVCSLPICLKKYIRLVAMRFSRVKNGSFSPVLCLFSFTQPGYAPAKGIRVDKNSSFFPPG